MNLHYSKTLSKKPCGLNLFCYPMNLHYSKTPKHNQEEHTQFYYPMNLHYSKTSKEDIWSCYQCMYHKAFQMHFIISLPFFQKNILSAMLVQICSTTLRFCTSSNVQIGIWSCYRRKSLANTLLQNCILNIHFFVLSFTTLWIYTTPKLNFDLLHWCELFYYPAILHLFKCSNKHLKLLPAQNARNYTTPKPVTKPVVDN